MTVLPDSGSPLVVNGATTLAKTSAIQTAFSGTTVSATAEFTFLWRGADLTFRVGESVHVEADLLAALTAASAHFTTP
jgi:hypothetical protein